MAETIMVHCGEGDCTNNLSKKNMISKWPGRQFIRFYLMPDPVKKKDLFLKWRSRIRRRPEDVKRSTRICSEHFAEEDFDPYDLANARKAASTKKMWIRLRPDSIPNTDRQTGKMIVHFSSPETEETTPLRPGRKRVRRDIEYIDELISDNDKILGSSSNDLSNTEPEDRYQVEKPSASENNDCVSIPSVHTNRYLSALMSASTETCKGVQVSPSKKDCSTQTGLSSLSVTRSSTSVEDLGDKFQESESDNELEQTSSDEEYHPGPLMAAASDKKVQRKTQMKTHGKVFTKTLPISWVYVNVSQLQQLFRFCPGCGGRVLQTRLRFTGAAVSVDYVCSLCTIGFNPSTWHGSPILRRKFVINIHTSCSIMLTGLRFQSMTNFHNLMELPTLSRPSFSEHVSSWLYPVIYRMYSERRDIIFDGLKKRNADGQSVVLCGDAQFDSPGFSAKYCTYTIMDCKTNEVVDFSVVQKGQFSGALEHQAFSQVWEGIVNEVGFQPDDLVIDRQATIAKIVEDHFPETQLSYDIWHMAKSLSTHLRTAAQSHPKIAMWQKSIVNHLWFSCRESKGDPDLAVEIFHSCLLHAANIHRWKLKRVIFQTFDSMRESIGLKRPYPRRPVKYGQCKHGPFSKGEHRSIQWFKVGDEDFLALFKVVTATRFSNDLRKRCKFLHTGKLESFHSMKLLYLPKLHSFELETMIVMTMLAAVQNNLYLKEENLKKSYTVRSYSRAMKKYVLKQKNVYDNVTFKKSIIDSIIRMVRSGEQLDKCNFSQTRYIMRPVPKTFHGQSAPDKRVMIENQKSRMK